MPAIDSYLRAVTKHGMDAIVLDPGRPPRLRRGATERELSTPPLDGRVIGRLVREVAPAGAFPGPAPAGGGGRLVELRYPLDGVEFLLRTTEVTGGWRLEALPQRGGEGAAATPAATAAATAPDGAGARAVAADAGSPPLREEGTQPVPTVAMPTAAAPAQAPAPGATADDASPRALSSILPLLEHLVDTGSSDLHLTAGEPPRVRLHGDLQAIPGWRPPTSDEVKTALWAIAPARNREEYESRNDSDFAYEIPGRARFRVNLFRDRKGVGAVFRQIPEKIPSADDLGLSEPIRRLALLSKGLVLVTGPTGSGKSTTLAAILDLVNRTRHDHIITIEDPVEFVHPSKGCLVNQREVGVHTGSFKHALRAALREDPDVVLVGEMRDLETISIAMETAETGHLVFGTLHTTTAISTVERIVDQFPGDRQAQVRMMLADSLRAVIAQTLLRRIGGGRVAAHEVLLWNPAVGNLIREGKAFQLASAMQTGRKQGMVMLNDSLTELVKKGIVEPREAYLKAVDKEGLVQKMRAANVDVGFLDQLLAEG
jgi:twitching motility protein PilT